MISIRDHGDNSRVGWTDEDWAAHEARIMDHTRRIQADLARIEAGRPSKLLTCHGKSLTVAAWSRELGVTESTIHGRLKKGLPIEQVLSPLMRRKTRNKNHHDNKGPTKTYQLSDNGRPLSQRFMPFMMDIGCAI